MKRANESKWWWRLGRSLVMRSVMLVLAVTALLPGKAAAAEAPDVEGIGNRIDRIRKQAKILEGNAQFTLSQRLGGENPDVLINPWLNHWNNHWNRWLRWNNWNNHWGNHWNNHH